jgi:hypothetical protein
MTDQESIEILNSLVPPKPSLVAPGSIRSSLTNGLHCKFDELSIAKDKAEHNHNQDETDHHNESEPECSGSGGGGCPFMHGSGNVQKPAGTAHKAFTKKFIEWQTSISIASEPIVYNDYLHLDKVLNAQFPVSKKYGNMAHDEHLFIIVHQG